jgi:hypothetical protein
MKGLILLMALLMLALGDIEIAHTAEDVAAFKTENDGDLNTFLFHNGHPHDGFWNSLMTSF